MGIMMKPAQVRARAPVARLAVLLSLGRELECSRRPMDDAGEEEDEDDGDGNDAASSWPAASTLARRRRALRLEK
jgi:hypothetical protein